MSLERASLQKHLGIYLDEKLNFQMQIEIVLYKVTLWERMVFKASFQSFVVLIWEVEIFCYGLSEWFTTLRWVVLYKVYDIRFWSVD